MKAEIAQKRAKLERIRRSIQKDAQVSLFHGLQEALDLGTDTRPEICIRLEREIAQLEAQIEAVKAAQERAKYMETINKIAPIWG